MFVQNFIKLGALSYYVGNLFCSISQQ